MSQRAIAEKNKVVEGLKEKIGRAKLMLIADYFGFSVKDVTDLRRKLRPEDSEFRVIKNTLIVRALAESGLAELGDQLKGPTALLLGYKDAVSPLKILVNFIKASEKGAIRKGVVDAKVFGKDDLNAISRLPSRQVLLGKAVGGIQAPLYGIVNVLQGPIRKLVYALDAIKNQKGGGSNG